MIKEENILLKTWNEQVKIFSDNLTISQIRPTRKAVHEIRVAMKKMRSYLRLKKKISKEKWREQFTGTLSLFKSFGNLRDVEMSLALTRKYEHKELLSTPVFKNYLSKDRTQSRRVAKQDAKNYNTDELLLFNSQFYLIANKLSNDRIYKRVVHLSLEKIDKIKELATHFSKNVHKIRKLLKDLYYWLKICPADIASKSVDLEELDKMLDDLGRWQDHFILREKINVYLKRSTVEEGNLKEFRKSLLKTQKKLLDKAKGKWHKVIK
jgi:CHAD domain-containing protein